MDEATTDSTSVDDLTLIQQVAAGNMRAFDALMQRHNQRLYRAVRGILHNEADAEEAVQEAWLKAYRHLRDFRGNAAPLTWLTRIAINEALMCHRRNKSLDAAIQPIESDEQADHIIATQGDFMSLLKPDQPDQLAYRTEMRRLIERRIDELPDHYRTVFMLRGVEGLSFAEVAATLDVSQATVRVRYMRARRLLHKALQQDIDLSAGRAFSFAGERCDRIVAGVHARLRESGVSGA
ncbi:MAG: RNA polymerase sigma factor [Rhodocyclaceae bacterium]